MHPKGGGGNIKYNLVIFYFRYAWVENFDFSNTKNTEHEFATFMPALKEPKFEID